MTTKPFVVSLEQAVAAPLCSRKLADFGARVVKVERPGGDFAREYDRVVDGQSTYFVWLNRGKESICLDLNEQIDRNLLESMAARADVFIQNLKPGALLGLGLDLGKMRLKNSRLITCSISGYGEGGPYAGRKAYDLLVQAECGLASITGSAHEPARVGVSVVDIAAGVTAYEAVLEALLRRENTGLGDHIDVSLFDAISDWMTVPLLHARYGSAPARVGLRHPNIAPYGAYDCLDRTQILISTQNDREWKIFCQQVLRRPDLLEDERFFDNTQRVRNRAELDTLIQGELCQMSVAEAGSRLQAADIAYGLINDLQAVLRHPQLRTVNVTTGNGTATVPAPAARHHAAHPHIGRVPALSEHEGALRREFAVNSQSDTSSR